MTSASTLAALVYALLHLSAVARGQVGRVTYPTASICALEGSTVDIPCTYTNPQGAAGWGSAVERKFWFLQRRGTEPSDLRADPWFAGRVTYLFGGGRCDVRISSLRKNDSAVYKFIHVANQQDGGLSNSPGVSLTVTALQIKKTWTKSCNLEKCRYFDLECDTGCLPSYSSILWYMNDAERNFKKKLSYYFYTSDTVFCSVQGHEAFPSPAECVYGDTCNKVTYALRSICAFTGSSVQISCSGENYNYFDPRNWFKVNDQWWPLEMNQSNPGRIRVTKIATHSTLTISDLKVNDSGEYRFGERSTKFPGTTLNVTDPRVEVQVVRGPHGPRLVCHTSCFSSVYTPFTWFVNGGKVEGQVSYAYTQPVHPAHSYSCSYESHRSTEVYAPKMQMFAPGDVERDSEVSLTCSCDANPTATITWYKNDQNLFREDSKLTFKSIQLADSGVYQCRARNELGEGRSGNVSVSVGHAPETCSLSVNASNEIVEGSSVALSCSCDASPAASYSWFKGQAVLQTEGKVLLFPTVRLEDRGQYTCECENKYGRVNSTSVFVDVQRSWKSAVAGMTTSALVLFGLLAALLWFWKSRHVQDQSERRAADSTQLNNRQSAGADAPAAAHRAEERGELLYSTICFEQTPEDSLYSNITRGAIHMPGEEEVLYSPVKRTRKEKEEVQRR